MAPPRRSLVSGLWSSLALVGLLLTTACVSRTPNSRDIGPPIGSTTQQQTEAIDLAVKTGRLQLEDVSDYVLGPGDQLQIRMVGRAEIFTDKLDQDDSIEVTQSPFMTFPLIGSIRVHGKTPGQLQEDLSKAYSQFFKDPIVIVGVKKYARNEVAVIGSVVTPGRYPLEPGDTISDAIYKAGGLTMGGRTGGLAPGPEMILLRERLEPKERYTRRPEELVDLLKNSEGAVMAREYIRIPISRFLFRGVMEYNLPLRQGDIVYIIPAGSVMVQGPVRNPGVVFLGPSIQTVSHVLTASGGMRFGASANLEVVRTDDEGNPKSYWMNGRRLAKRADQDFVLRDGDQVFVYRDGFRSVLEWFGNIFDAGLHTGLNATYNPVGAP